MSQQILPWNVRYALQYKDGIMSSDDLKSLVSGGFPEFASYLVFKVLDGNIDQQENFTKRIVNEVNKNKDSPELSNLIWNVINEIGSLNVDGRKVAQMSRYNPTLVKRAFFEGGSNLYKENKTPILTAYSASIGMIPLLKAMEEKDTFIQIFPSQFKNANFCGYLFAKKENITVEKISPISNLDSIRQPIIVDETVNSGNTLIEILNYWQSRNWPEITEGRFIGNTHGLDSIAGIPLKSLEYSH